MCRSILIPMMISTLINNFDERSMECETGDRARVGGGCYSGYSDAYSWLMTQAKNVSDGVRLKLRDQWQDLHKVIELTLDSDMQVAWYFFNLIPRETSNPCMRPKNNHLKIVPAIYCAIRLLLGRETTVYQMKMEVFRVRNRFLKCERKWIIIGTRPRISS